ncbi:MAG: 16S rRNA (cytosine(1402)-N(4))-methyltransferase RsmH, partial [bacterium]|nr:16S rRNA (cytosine(1402)-N(4))-methyltransferase RsmH [bacterium]
PGNRYVDCTVGAGGHAREILKIIGSSGSLRGIDCDSETLTLTSRRLQPWPNFIPFHANFFELSRILSEVGWTGFDGIMFDLGFSSLQVDDPERGFSFTRDGPLDMRMDRNSNRSAADLVNDLSEKELGTVIKKLGEEPLARRLARAVARERKRSRIQTTGELKSILEGSVPTGNPIRKQLAVRRTFMALRIAVNRELDDLREVLQTGVKYLRPGGRMVVLSYHSLEDRIVKHAFRDLSGRCTCPSWVPECRCEPRTLLKILASKPIIPEEGEIRGNPRARSAKLRAIERL